MQHHYFVTGTDTAVGKSYFCAWLTRQWRARGYAAAALKPIACGDRADARLLRRAGGGVLSLKEINPVHFRHPLAPWPASRLERRRVDLRAACGAVSRLRPRFARLLVEGVGGWRVPLTRRLEVREWACRMELPVLVVARAGLGTLNHTLLTVQSIRDAGCRCAGVVLNHHHTRNSPAVRTNPQILRELARVPVFSFTARAEKEGELPAWLE